MKLCDYGCGQEAKHQFKNGKWCCSDSHNKCPVNRNKNKESHLGEKNHMHGKEGYWKNKKFSKTHRENISKVTSGENHPNYGKKRPKEVCLRISIGNIGKKRTKEQNRKQSLIQRQSIEDIKRKYPFFSQVEEMRYNPNKLIEEKEIQVHCKYNECENSKEKGGWFTPTYIQLYERIRHLEQFGKDNCYFYCSQQCKDSCPIYGKQGGDPFKNKDFYYTGEEIRIWKERVKELDDSKCQICESTENIHVHHIIPQKLEPFFSLDPINGICLCEICHFKYGHSDDGCKTSDLAQQICKRSKNNGSKSNRTR